MIFQIDKIVNLKFSDWTQNLTLRRYKYGSSEAMESFQSVFCKEITFFYSMSKV